jgi:membrane fusion protein, macrolide-specific efflux system
MKRKIKILMAILVIAAAASLLAFKFTGSKNQEAVTKEIHPSRGDIQTTVSTTGIVYPRNRLEVVPSVAGRIDKMLVNEGDTVRKGQILAYMSSSDRASLIDAARAQGAEALKYWENAYKPIPIIAPIDGTVIVRTIEPGQPVTTATDIVVISDKLIVRASVDETDIGRVALGQRASVSLDAHPEITVKGKVDHIYYESTTSNNVTIYYVQIECDRIPAVFRSGMSANIEIVEKMSRNALLLPSEAVKENNGEKYVVVKGEENGKPRPEKRVVTTGLASNDNIEITSGLSDADTILISSKTFVLPKSDNGKNMFMPSGTKNNKNRGQRGPM